MSSTDLDKVRTATACIAEIFDGATLVIAGTGPVLEPDLLLQALEKRFLDSGSPRGITVLSPMCPGARPGTGGMNCVAHDGMLAKLLTSSIVERRHPRLVELIDGQKCDAYMVPMGSIMGLLGAMGARRPGLITNTGLGSSIDPRFSGGAMNERSKAPPVALLELEGRDHLFYPSFPIDFAFIRASTADENGYLSMEEESNTLGIRDMALATKASGGTVIAQVKRLARGGSLHPKAVEVPGPLVDFVVVNPYQTQLTTGPEKTLEDPNLALTGTIRVPLSPGPAIPVGPARTLLRRAALELDKGDVVNVGAGVATNLPRIVNEEGCLDLVTFTNEHGVFGGLLATELTGSFVPSINPTAIMDSSFQFPFYEGGGLDIAFLGIGQVDSRGDVNVSYFDGHRYGPGGLNSIAENASRVVFCGAMTVEGLVIETHDGNLNIVQEGRKKKFIASVEEITFNGRRAWDRGQEVKYITERAVFVLSNDGLVLTEIAPGVDLNRDILPNIGFPVQVSSRLVRMPEEIFKEGPLALATILGRQSN